MTWLTLSSRCGTRSPPPRQRDSAEYRDFLTVNEILIRVKDKIKPLLLTPDVARVDERLRSMGRHVGHRESCGAIATTRGGKRVEMHAQEKTEQTDAEAGANLRDYDGGKHVWRDRGVGALSMTCLGRRFGG